MHFGNKLVNNDNIIYISNGKFVRVLKARFLGVIIDYRLNCKRHIEDVMSKISKSVSILYRASQRLNVDALIMIYNPLI